MWCIYAVESTSKNPIKKTHYLCYALLIELLKCTCTVHIKQTKKNMEIENTQTGKKDT